MRVVLVVHEFPKASEAFLVDQFLGLLRRHVDAYLVAERENAAGWALFPELEAARGRVFSWPRSPLRRALRAGGLLGRVRLRHLRQILRAARGAWRHAPAEAPGRAAFALPLMLLDPDVVHLEFGSLGYHRRELKEALACPLVLSLRGWDISYFRLEEPDAFAPVWRVVDRVHVLGADLLARARERGLPPDVPVEAISPCVDASRFRPEPREARRGSLRLLSVGRLHWKKGYEFALAAVRRVVDAGHEVDYRIVGTGDFEPALRACIGDFGLASRVRLLGELDRTGIRAQLQWADAFLHAAVSEGFCNAVLEAQAMELPVVCSDAEGLAENVVDGVTGLVTRRRDPEALAEALASLAGDSARARRMGAAGRRHVVASFDPERQIEAFIGLYERARGRESPRLE